MRCVVVLVLAGLLGVASVIVATVEIAIMRPMLLAAGVPRVRSSFTIAVRKPTSMAKPFQPPGAWLQKGRGRRVRRWLRSG